MSDSRVLPPALRRPFDPVSERRQAELQVADYDPIHELKPCRLKPIACGRLAIVQGERKTGVSIPIIGYLLQTDEELIVVDCGLSPRWRDGGEVHRALDESLGLDTPYIPELDGPSLAEQVSAMGLKPDRLICTHLHEDHSSDAHELGLTLEASAAEFTALDQPGADQLGYPVSDLSGVARRPIDLDRTAPLGPFPASAQINPQVIALDTSGHTPGSISLLACLGAAWVLICGDAVYPRMDDPEAPAWLGMLRISRALDDLRGLRVLPGHDTTVLRYLDAGEWMGTSAPPAVHDHEPAAHDHD
ncbi:MAG TPA: MBL fold metallo-hydrolase [Candidatus Solibacter sp.]|jgi:glyoxylase-like metal-dependent hydrolase (beta-lactamase superfamily II)|nr:MBL fold metallo-hydrolase [Candidatus Solibacter sp.]